MSIYHLESYNSLQTPGVRFDTVPDYAELLALLNLVIPSSDVLLPPVETPLTGDSPPISTPFCTSQDVFECAFQVDSSRYLSEPVSSVTPNLPSSEQISDWIEPMPYRCLDPAFSSDTPLGELLAFLVAEDTITVPGTDQNKSNECQIVGCHTKKQSNGRCIRHGGGRRCNVQGCTRGAQSMGRCKRHGGGARCTIEGCTTSSQGGGLCRTHGGGKLCTAPGCKKGTQRQGKCATHASRKCSIDNCSRNARFEGICSRHMKERQKH